VTGSLCVLLLPLLAAPAAAAPSSPAPARSAPVASTERPSRALGGLGLAGILVSAAGTGLASTGVVRLVQGRTRAIAPGDRELLLVTDFRPQGRALLGVGLGAVAIGAAALIVDLTVLRIRRSRRVALAPFVAPSAAGLVVGGRFQVRARR
jgi:hypothetical protein